MIAHINRMLMVIYLCVLSVSCKINKVVFITFLSPFTLYENYTFSVSGAAHIFKKISKYIQV